MPVVGGANPKGQIHRVPATHRIALRRSVRGPSARSTAQARSCWLATTRTDMSADTLGRQAGTAQKSKE